MKNAEVVERLPEITSQLAEATGHRLDEVTDIYFSSGYFYGWYEDGDWVSNGQVVPVSDLAQTHRRNRSTGASYKVDARLGALKRISDTNKEMSKREKRMLAQSTRALTRDIVFYALLHPDDIPHDRKNAVNDLFPVLGPVTRYGARILRQYQKNAAIWK